MKIVKRNEGYARTTVAGDVATVVHVTGHDKVPKGMGYLTTTRMDFAKVSRETLIELASAKILIDLRATEHWHSLPDPTVNDGRTVSVAEFLATPRKRKGPDPDDVKAKLRKLTPEQRKAILDSFE